MHIASLMLAEKFIGIMLADWSEENSELVDGIRLELKKTAKHWKYRTFVGSDRWNDSISYNLHGYIVGPKVVLQHVEQAVVRAVTWGDVNGIADATMADATASWISPETLSRLAVRHLSGQGFRRLAAVWPGGRAVEAANAQEFLKKAKEQGIPCSEWQSGVNTTEEDLYEFLLGLEAGTGIYCPSDLMAQWVRDSCLINAIPVPEKLGILGLGDVSEYCLSQEPAISSIAFPWRSIGRLAFESLRSQLLYQRNDPIRELRLVSVTQRSTTQLDNSLKSDLVLKAEKLIRRSLALNWSVAELAQKLNTSVATLNRHWKKNMPRISMLGEHCGA